MALAREKRGTQMNILGIETSCDETAAAVVRDGREVLSNTVFSQIPLHKPWGGVVPEIAGRSHVEKIGGVVDEALSSSGLAPEEIDAVAVTFGPGLSASLIVGLNAAKGLALALGKPLYCVNHIEAHLHTPFLSASAPDPLSVGRMLGLAVSGGHTAWIDMPRYGEYRIIGQTLDDACGEAFDKAAKLLGLGYPGGPVIDRIAKTAKSRASAAFPKCSPRPGTDALGGLDASLCVSFSGLKTSLLYRVRNSPPQGEDEVAALAASYQDAIVDAVAVRTARALKRGGYAALTVGGGVSLNSALRERLARVAADAGVRLLLAEPRYCGDNAAMIAGLAFYRRTLEGAAALSADIVPSLRPGAEAAH